MCVSSPVSLPRCAAVVNGRLQVPSGIAAAPAKPFDWKVEKARQGAAIKKGEAPEGSAISLRPAGDESATQLSRRLPAATVVVDLRGWIEHEKTLRMAASGQSVETTRHVTMQLIGGGFSGEFQPGLLGTLKKSQLSKERRNIFAWLGPYDSDIALVKNSRLKGCGQRAQGIRCNAGQKCASIGSSNEPWRGAKSQLLFASAVFKAT